MLDFDGVSSDKILTRYDIVVEAKEKPEDIAAKILPKDGPQEGRGYVVF